VAPARQPFRRAPLALQALITGSVLAALALPFLLRHLGQTSTKNSLSSTLAALLVIFVVNVELGRLHEGGISRSDRAHKALSAWGSARRSCCRRRTSFPWSR
jgi:hypothetical protein